MHQKGEYTYDFGGEEEEDLHWEAEEHGGKCPVCGKESCSCSSNNKRTWGGFILDVVQGGLDLVDLSETPIISQAAAVSNAGISYLRGDKFGAGVSMAGIFLPGITAIKYAKVVDEIAAGGGEIINFLKKFSSNIEDNVKFSEQLKRLERGVSGITNNPGLAKQKIPGLDLSDIPSMTKQELNQKLSDLVTEGKITKKQANSFLDSFNKAFEVSRDVSKKGK